MVSTRERSLAAVTIAALGLSFGCQPQPDAEVDKVTSALNQPGVAGGQCGFVERLANGDVLFAIKFPVAQAYVEVFSKKNGVQNISKAMAGGKNADGSFTYRTIVPAATYVSGDKILTRFYSYEPNQPGVFTPGPTATTFLPQFVYGSSTCAENIACTGFLQSPTYVQQASNGNLQFSVTLPTGQQFVEVFVQQNDVQTIAQNIVASGVANPDGTKTYSLVSQANKYKAGDRVLTRFYSYKPNAPGVFTPGSTDNVWAPLLVYNSTNTCDVQCGQQTCSGHGNCAAGSSPGQIVCNCAAGFQGPACATPGGGTVLAGRPPRTLPQPPRVKGCYVGTANGWFPTPCAPSGTIGKITTTATAIQTPNGASATIPFQFGQVEATYTAFGGVTDSVDMLANEFSLQGNTNVFTSTAVPASIPGAKVGDQAWVQFVVQPNATNTFIKIESWDITKFNAVLTCPGNLCDVACGCIDYGVATIPNRPGGYKQFDFATAAGSVYNDDGGNPLIGMVLQFSWYDPGNDPGNQRGLYSVVAADDYGLAAGWREFSGTFMGYGAGSRSDYANTSVLTRTLAGSCADGSSPVGGIPWPGVCTPGSDLLAATTMAQVKPTAEDNNMCKVGNDTPLVAANSDTVWTQNLYSTSCMPTPACISTADRLFVRSTEEDTGVRPINFGTQAFWESPDLLVVPAGTQNVNVNFVASETLLTPGQPYDIYVRVNNDFSCNTMNGAKALVYIADPSTLSTAWVSITGGTYQGNVSVPPGQRGLLGPYTFTAPADVPANAGHKCLLAAIAATGEDGPANTTDPLSSFQVAQRNIQLSNCVMPLTNGTPTNGKLSLILTATGATPGLAGSNNFSIAFDDPGQVWFNTWITKAGGSYAVTQAGGKTTVRLGQPSVTLDPVPLASGVSITGNATVTLDTGEPKSKLEVAAQLKDGAGTVLVSNGLSCQADAPPIIK